MPKNRAITLVELVVAIIIFGLMIGGIWAIENFARYHLKTAQQRAKLQNEVSYILEHMTKNVTMTVGNLYNLSETGKILVNGSVSGHGGTGGYSGFFVDAADDRVSSGDGIPGTQGDHWVCYVYSGPYAIAGKFTEDDIYKMFYYPFCSEMPTGLNFATVCSDRETLVNSGHIISAMAQRENTPLASPLNYVNASVNACWDPTEAKAACGTPDNPSVNMQTRVKMPMVSTR